MVREGYYVAKVIINRCIRLLGMLLLVYLTENASFLSSLGVFFSTYIFRPALWVGIAYTVWCLPGLRPVGKLKLRSFLMLMAVILAIFQIVLMLLAGIGEGFGKSPYSFTPLGIILNIILVGSSLVGGILSRSYLLGALTSRRPFLVITLISLLFTVISLPLSRLTNFQSYYDFLKYTGSFIMPAFAENLLTSYLAYLGGPLPALIYQGILQGFSWFCPILPNLSWITKTLLGTCIPFFSLLVLQHLYLREAREIKKSLLQEENPLSWIVTSIASVLIIWFAVGLFPYYPSVIITGSMEPMIKPGDVVLVKKIAGAEVQQGDVIHFRLDKITVTHRVIAINDEEDRQFQTKGDNNDVADIKPVETAQVKGKVVRVIPKLGWLTLLLHSKGDLL